MKDVDYTDAAPALPLEPTAVPSEAADALGKRLLKLTRPYMRGTDITVLQTMLNAQGFSCGNTDGIFGEKTRAGVMAFQAAKGLVVDGIAGPETKKALLIM